MSKHRNTNPQSEFVYGDQPQAEEKKGISKKWKIGVPVVIGLGIVGLMLPTDSDEDTTASTTSTTPETHVDRPVPETVTPAVEEPEPTTTPTETQEAVGNTDEARGNTLRFEASTSDGSTGSVTYIAENFDIIQHQDEPMPWSVDVEGIGDSWDVLGANISVQQNGSGEVTCRVLWNGEVVSENTSTGEFAIAMCSLPSTL